MMISRAVQRSTNPQIFDCGSSWLVKNNIKKPLFTFFKNFLEINKKYFKEIDIEKYSTTGNARQYSVTEDKKYVFLDEEKFLKAIDIVKKLVKKDISFLQIGARNPNQDYDLILHSAWYVEGEENSYHKIHNHDPPDSGLSVNIESRISCVIYLDDNGIDEKNGQIYFVMNTTPKNIFHITENILTFTPQNQNIFSFPYYLYHGTYPQAAGKRTTMSLEFIIVPLEKNQTNLYGKYT